MKRITLLAVIVAGLTIGTLSSCSKEETASNTTTTSTDSRDLAVGTYYGMTLGVIGTDSIVDSTSFTISKGSGNTVTILEDGVTITTGAIVVDGKDFSGNIPTQNITTDGVTYSIQGQGTNNEQFAFDATLKGFAYDIRVTGGPMNGATITTYGYKR